MGKATVSHQLLANAGSPPISFRSGDVIFQEGEQGDKMYILQSGEVEIAINGKIVETLSQEGIFGEMALIDGSPRSATARAKTHCEVAPISEKNFLFLVDEMPHFALSVMRTLVDRLRRLDKIV
jgi:CRP/FNR family cyclic AMP-dependent transcriptional regulator